MAGFSCRFYIDSVLLQPFFLPHVGTVLWIMDDTQPSSGSPWPIRLVDNARACEHHKVVSGISHLCNWCFGRISSNSASSVFSVARLEPELLFEHQRSELHTHLERGTVCIFFEPFCLVYVSQIPAINYLKAANNAMRRRKRILALPGAAQNETLHLRHPVWLSRTEASDVLCLEVSLATPRINDFLWIS